jgi:hypothetical protein
VRHDQSHEPDEPADRDPRRRHQRGRGQEHAAPPDHVDAEVGRRLLAQQQRVEQPGARQDQRAPESDERQRDEELRPARGREAPQQVEDDLRQLRT